jgi:hypothetical protein
MDNIPFLNTVDLEILKHKDSHFGGSFKVMLDYYRSDGVGVQEDFDIERIQDLADFDKDGHLSAEILPDHAKNEVFFSKELYKKLKSCYDKEEPFVRKLADLILTESWDPSEEIEALAECKQAAIKPLIEIVSQDHFYNPLNPGYGRAPINAALTLKKIGNTDAIAHLYNALGKSFSTDEILINTLISFGERAEDFLRARLEGSPYTKDNYLAAMVLSSFPTSEQTAKLALDLLSKKQTHAHSSYVSYLICICEGLKTSSDREMFIQLSKNEDLSKNIASEMALVISFWKNSY